MADLNNNNEINEIQKFVNLWSETYKPLAWTSIVYFVFWYPPWTLFCLAWVTFTALISLASLIIPPLGYCFCIGSVISWRSLARIELLTVSYCINPKNFIKDSITEIERNGGLFYPITKISPTRTAFPGYIQFGAEFVSHQHTRNCFFYFTFYKTFTLLLFVVLFPKVW
ncbi:14529_t:CDS:2 [Funneliformis mosseae]|uniref:14529_t:CDS:1 n=1 Tax=Funneliformis mosseae TaxID=27381 RepID=A0A9N9DEI9_FUNMO|nr:14529_t:CDS:2 [Funneliformis mosseae]